MDRYLPRRSLAKGQRQMLALQAGHHAVVARAVVARAVVARGKLFCAHGAARATRGNVGKKSRLTSGERGW
jgi:hypothetical protein